MNKKTDATMCDFVGGLAQSAVCGLSAAVLLKYSEEGEDLVFAFSGGSHPIGFEEEHVPSKVRELVPGPGVGGLVWQERDLCRLYVDPVLDVLCRRLFNPDGATLYLAQIPSIESAYMIAGARIGRVLVAISEDALPKPCPSLEYLKSAKIPVILAQP